MIFCFDIGGSAIKGGIADDPDTILPLPRHATPLDDFDAFAGTLSRVIAESGRSAHAGIAISITGAVDPDSGRITCANIPCLDGRFLARDLQDRLGCPVLIANDADCFALAEAGAGAGRGHRIVFGAILGTGVGGGIVVEGRLLRGVGGITGEWGHGPIVASFAGTPPFPIPRLPCGCGQTGCLDTVGGARGLERVHHLLHASAASSTQIVSAWEAGDSEARRTVECWLDLVADPLALVVNTLGPSIVPVGGGLSNSHDLIAALDQAVRRRILRRTDQPLVVPAQCVVEPGLVGAGILGLTELAA